MARSRTHRLWSSGARRGRQSANGAIGRHQYIAFVHDDVRTGQRARRIGWRSRRRPARHQPKLRIAVPRLFPDCRGGRRARQYPRTVHRSALAWHCRHRLQIFASRVRCVLHLRSDHGDSAVAPARLVRSRMTSRLVDGFARRHRYSVFEALPWLAAFAGYFVFPSYLALGAQILATILFALSADLVLGYAGIVTLGHAAFFGTGAYTAGILAANGWGEPITGLLAAAAAAGLLGLVSGLVVLRTTGLSLLMQTLVVATMVAEAANKASFITGGDDGLQGIEVWPIFGWLRFDLFGRTAYLYCLIVVLLCWWAARHIVHSPFGRSLTGIRENVRRMHAIGGARRHIRRADRANDAIRQSQLSVSGTLGDRLDHADHRRGRTALRRLHRRPALHDCARSLLHSAAGVLVFLDRAADGRYRCLCTRRRAWALRPIPAMSTPALETRALHKSFGALTVANSINFRLDPGARQALIGPNGAGKTSFVELVTGALRPDAGQIFLSDTDVTALPQAARVKRGLIRTFQITALFRRLSVIENVTLAVCERQGIGSGRFRPSGHYRAAIEEAYALLERLGLEDDALRPANMLAYGRQRLVEVAVSLALSPKVLLLDEPAAGVPSGESGMIIEVIESLPPDIALLIIEHDMDLVFRLAQRITVLVQGSVLIEGPPEAIAADPEVRRVYLGERMRA